MNFSFHKDAALELNRAIEYYETCSTGLGYDFALEVYETIIRIIANPHAWQEIDENIRRSLVNRFPFGILYACENNTIYILAIMHLHRSPDYWKTRV
ncbi:MAG: type II toxin-antitoxin system RelE/ParE family toxin [Bacteroidetes bacterium]|nr:type II toxin-antitoxin system RelE/ParE family toxin [Bacteroidota bacterium]